MLYAIAMGQIKMQNRFYYVWDGEWRGARLWDGLLRSSSIIYIKRHITCHNRIIYCQTLCGRVRTCVKTAEWHFEHLLWLPSYSAYFINIQIQWLLLRAAIRLSDPEQDSQWISVQIHVANRMTLDVSNVSPIHCESWSGSDNRIAP